jgi:hypothetical protein
MSIRRLLRLAGIKINESISDDPELNSEIDSKIAMKPAGIRSIWYDLLEIIKDGNGVSPIVIANTLKKIYENDPQIISFISAELPRLLDSLVDEFPGIIRKDKGLFFWKNTSNDDEVDPEFYAAVNSHVNSTYSIKEIITDLSNLHGSFSGIEVAKELAKKENMPLQTAVVLTNHFLEQFTAIVEKLPDGRYRWKPEKINTNNDSMALFRDLERKAKKI